jgi:hypothetical protein
MIGVAGSPRMLSFAVAHHSTCLGNGNRASKNSTAPLGSSVTTSTPNSFSHFSIWPEIDAPQLAAAFADAIRRLVQFVAEHPELNQIHGPRGHGGQRSVDMDDRDPM